jgi:hypothetical protein
MEQTQALFVSIQEFMDEIQPYKSRGEEQNKRGEKTREIEKEENLESKGREPKNQIGKE